MNSPIQQLSAKLRLPSTISRSDDSTDEIPLLRYPSNSSAITAHETSKDNLADQPSPLGSPAKKGRIYVLDLVALAIALGSSAVAIATVQNDTLAWNLRYQNQLVVVGFLLSIMNQCLARVVPFLSLLLETRFGPSTIQNYEGILSNQFLRARMHFVWRMTIIFFLALPIVLSVSYKRFFPNGSATISLHSADITGRTPSYGLFPTMTDYHHYDGLSIYFNATIPFKLASNVIRSSNCSGKSGPCVYTNTEPTLPEFPQAYGANVLLVDNYTSAMLDMPSGDRLKALQDSLSFGDSLNINANVSATVAQWNHNSTPVNDELFQRHTKDKNNWHYDTIDLLRSYRMAIFSPYNAGDKSHVWIGTIPYTRKGWNDSIENFAPHAKRYDISRRLCHGNWSITRGGIGLLNGSCRQVLPDKLSDEVPQTVFMKSKLVLGITWLSPMANSLSMFAGTRDGRSESLWQTPSTNTFVAGMLWAATTAQADLQQRTDLTTNPDIPKRGLLYDVDERVTSTRITMEKSQWLYFVLIIQPLLMIMAMIAIYFLHSVPIERDFGIVSILAGVDRETVGLLHGASLSGKLKEDIQLSINPVTTGGRTVLHYRFGPRDGVVSNGRLNHSTTYF